MQTLKVYEVGVDDLPLDNTEIVFWDSISSFGMFENSFAVEGVVRYLLPDEFDTLEEAIAGGSQINLDFNYEDEDIIIQCNEKHLGNGIKWMYVHEYYPVTSTIDFPFQKRIYFDVAIQQGWIEIVSHENVSFSQEEYDNIIANTSKENSHLIPDFQECKARLESDIFIVSFNGSKFKVTFTDSQHFRAYESVD